MIMGLITSVFLFINRVAYRPFHLIMQNVLQCIADGTINQMACQAGGSSGGFASPGGGGGLFNALSGLMNQVGGLLNNLLSNPSSSSAGSSSGPSATSTVGTQGSDAAVSNVRVTATTETFTGADGAQHQTTRVCTTDVGLLQAHEGASGRLVAIVDIQSASRPQVGANLRVPVWEVGPGQWRAQLPIDQEDLAGGSSYCLSLTDVQGPTTTVTNVRFTAVPER